MADKKDTPVPNRNSAAWLKEHVTKEGQKKPSWTWRYGKERYQDLRNSIVMAIRSR